MKKIINIFLILVLVFIPNVSFAENTNSTDLESGSSQYWSHVDNVALSVLNGWTVEVWFKAESLPTSVGFPMFIAGQRNSENGWAIGVINNGSNDVRFSVWTGSGAFGNLITTATVSTGVWYHMAVFYDGSSTKVYIDEASAETLSMAGITNSTGNFIVGGKPNSPTGDNFDGLVDELRIWDDERTASEITDNWKIELGGSEAGLRAYYKFNNDGTDSKGSLDLTNNNSATFSTDVPFTDVVAEVGFNSFTIFD